MGIHFNADIWSPSTYFPYTVNTCRQLLNISSYLFNPFPLMCKKNAAEHNSGPTRVTSRLILKACSVSHDRWILSNCLYYENLECKSRIRGRWSFSRDAPGEARTLAASCMRHFVQVSLCARRRSSFRSQTFAYSCAYISTCSDFCFCMLWQHVGNTPVSIPPPPSSAHPQKTASSDRCPVGTWHPGEEGLLFRA